jgi:hypothetical protein
MEKIPEYLNTKYAGKIEEASTVKIKINNSTLTTSFIMMGETI